MQPPPIVLASDYLLETVFWNIWQNAQQAAGPDCRLSVRLLPTAGSISLLVIDSGPGFPEAAYEVAFRDQFSTNGANRGRGLLEIEDAVRRLQGGVRLEAVGTGELRLRFDFPVYRQ